MLWILDLPGPLALEVAHALRRRRSVASALCFNAWYDPRGVLDGRAEIPLLLTLGERLATAPAARGACLVFDARRHEPASPALLDNRYRLGDEDAPTIEHLRAAGYRGVTAITEGEPAPDDSAPVPHAMPGPRTPREKALSLTIAASFLAASSLGLGRAPAPIPAPNCAPGDVRAGNVPWDDPGAAAVLALLGAHLVPLGHGLVAHYRPRLSRLRRRRRLVSRPRSHIIIRVRRHAEPGPTGAPPGDR